jgi:hypothetical protein
MYLNYTNMIGKVVTLFEQLNRNLPGFCEFTALLLWLISENILIFFENN